MQIVRFNPVKNMFNVRSRINHMFDDFFGPARKDSEGLDLWRWKPVVDVYDNDDSTVIKAELPGLKREDIVVDVQGHLLTLKGERSFENEIKEDKFYRKERACGRFERVFTLPAEVDPENIKADYKDGVLTINIPKPVEEKPKKITVH